MSDFFRFPSTVHLDVGASVFRSDKVMTKTEQREFLKNDLIAEEKLDGANIGISQSLNGKLRIQNRGGYIIEPFTGQFSRLSAWLAMHSEKLNEVCGNNKILFGEWCAARHSIEYSSLPDFFLLFDVFDADEVQFWSVIRRNALASFAGLYTVPRLDIVDVSISGLWKTLEDSRSKFSSARMEGIVFRNDSPLWNIGRAKLVRSDFTQAIDDHWTKRRLTWNKLASL
jgi:ATP-dependent RNA circularization protein (DNA/RNA ligase family)